MTVEFSELNGTFVSCDSGTKKRETVVKRFKRQRIGRESTLLSSGCDRVTENMITQQL